MADLDRLKARAAEIAERETKILLDRTPGSKALHERALKSLPAGVASNFQAGDPYPVYLKRGSRARACGTSTAPSTPTSTAGSA